ncbi:hypothetical protein, partial [Pseudomonas putida]|uniref:hypothetical protein n=1 Tax=Pseudomonas putida TaxID=303 RepID=UPI001E53AF9E
SYSLLQRGHTCEAMIVSWMHGSSHAPRLATMASQVRHVATTVGFIRDAPRGRRSVSQALNSVWQAHVGPDATANTT